MHSCMKMNWESRRMNNTLETNAHINIISKEYRYTNKYRKRERERETKQQTILSELETMKR